VKQGRGLHGSHGRGGYPAYHLCGQLGELGDCVEHAFQSSCSKKGQGGWSLLAPFSHWSVQHRMPGTPISCQSTSPENLFTKLSKLPCFIGGELAPVFWPLRWSLHVFPDALDHDCTHTLTLCNYFLQCGHVQVERFKSQSHNCKTCITGGFFPYDTT
jgi:hypothetical protein